MSDLFTPLDEGDPRLALGATGVLAAFNTAGVISSADVHVARTLGEVAGETDESALLAVALTCRALRSGSVCLDLSRVRTELEALPSPTQEDPDASPDPLADLPWPDADDWAARVTASPLVTAGVVQWNGHLLYLDRYHEQETQVLDDLTRRAESAPVVDTVALEAALDRVFPPTGYDEQRAAVRTAASRWTTVVTGGPGTGKTTTVAGLLVALQDQFAATGHPPRVALAAPTGKAAARLQEAVRESASRFDAADRARLEGITTGTLHRLLRRDPGNSTRFRHHRHNRLPHDVIVVDETSMVSLTMMARLLEAVRPDARLVLVGDADQLSSVEAGAVLGDLVAGYRDHPDSPVASLVTAHRYGAEIGALAEALRSDDVDTVLDVLAAGHEQVEWVQVGDPGDALRAATLPTALAVREAARIGDADTALAALAGHRLLCAHRDGPYGVHTWNRRIEQWITAATGDPLRETFHVGRPVLVTSNDYALGVHNGDSGVVVETVEGRRVVIEGDTGLRSFTPARMGQVETMHAMTIHKAQGSQATEVTVLLPSVDSRLLTRELFYTAVTRAREKVRVVGTEAEVRAAVARTARRASGLAERLSGSTRD